MANSLPPGWIVAAPTERSFRIVFEVDRYIEDPLSMGAILMSSLKIKTYRVERYSIIVPQSVSQAVLSVLTVDGLKETIGFDVRRISILSVSPVEG